MSEPTSRRANPFAPVRLEWLAQRSEEILDADIAIVDAHHHLWDRAECPYLMPDLLADAQSGHAVRGTIFVECRARYRRDGDRAMRSLGETKFAAMAAAEAARLTGSSHGLCAGIVAFIDLQEGGPAVEALIDAHARAACGRLRGIRNISAWDPESVAAGGKGPAQGLLTSPAFREGFARLASRELTFDAWMFHTQLAELRDLADAFPDTPIVLNHVGGPVDSGWNRTDREGIFRGWSGAMRILASCPNVHVNWAAWACRSSDSGFMTSPTRPLPSSSPMLGGPISRPAFKHLVPRVACSKVIFRSINAAAAMPYCGTPSSESPRVARDRSAISYLAERPRLSIG